MSNLEFTVADMFADPYTLTPQLTARLRISESTELSIHSIALRVQVRIEPQRRAYTAEEERGVRDLFGPRERWYDTLKPFLWMQTSAMVQGFTGLTDVDLALPCTYDFDVAAARYLHALGDGAVPLTLMFSGTAFTRGEHGFAVQQVPWSCEARHDLPVRVWRDMMATYFPNAGWLRLDHDVLGELADYRARHGLVSWEETVTRLLAREDTGQGVTS